MLSLVIFFRGCVSLISSAQLVFSFFSPKIWSAAHSLPLFLALLSAPPSCPPLYPTLLSSFLSYIFTQFSTSICFPTSNFPVLSTAPLSPLSLGPRRSFVFLSSSFCPLLGAHVSSSPPYSFLFCCFPF